MPEKPRKPARFGFVGINRERLVAAAAGMRDVVGAAAKRSEFGCVFFM